MISKTAILRFAFYYVVMWLLLLPVFAGAGHFTIAGILAIQAAQLNEIKSKL